MKEENKFHTKKVANLNKGITLVALIITIVVLLILAVVVIAAIQNNRIIEQAQSGANKYVEAQEKEHLMLTISEWVFLEDTQSCATFAEFLGKEFGESNVVDNGDGTVTITTEKGNKYKVKEDGTIKKTIEVGSYVEYDVSYTDMYQGKEFDSTNGWRYLGTEAETGNHLLISTGIPMVLYYHSSTAGGNAKWWDITKTNANEQATSGMINNFDKIPYAQKASGNWMSSGTENTAIGRFAASKRTYEGAEYDAVGDYFKVTGKTYSNDITVRTLTLAELNRAVNSASGSNRVETSETSGFKELTGEALGLFDMQDLTLYTENYYYWLASTDTGNANNVYRVSSYATGVNGSDSRSYGVRPVVVISSDVEIEDTNEDGVYEIKK